MPEKRWSVQGQEKHIKSKGDQHASKQKENETKSHMVRSHSAFIWHTADEGGTEESGGGGESGSRAARTPESPYD